MTQIIGGGALARGDRGRSHSTCSGGCGYGSSDDNSHDSRDRDMEMVGGIWIWRLIGRDTYRDRRWRWIGLGRGRGSERWMGDVEMDRGHVRGIWMVIRFGVVVAARDSFR